MKKISLLLVTVMLVMSFAGFTAFAENDMVTITFRTSDGEAHFLKDHQYAVNEITVEHEYGYTLTEADAPEIYELKPGTYSYQWDTDFVGTVVTGDMIITLIPICNTKTFTVTFYGWDGEIVKVQNVPEGFPANPPKLEDKDGIMVVDWYTEAIDLGNGFGIDQGRFTRVLSDMKCHPTPRLRGDANKNDKLDAADATLILREALHFDSTWPLDIFSANKQYDYNKNLKIDAGDATGILRAITVK